MSKDLFTTPTTANKRESMTSNTEALDKLSKELVIQDQSGTNLQALDEKVKSMMEKGEKLENEQMERPTGKIINLQSVWQGGPLESDKRSYCEKTLSSRNSLQLHKRRFHK